MTSKSRYAKGTTEPSVKDILRMVKEVSDQFRSHGSEPNHLTIPATWWNSLSTIFGFNATGSPREFQGMRVFLGDVLQVYRVSDCVTKEPQHV